LGGRGFIAPFVDVGKTVASGRYKHRGEELILPVLITTSLSEGMSRLRVNVVYLWCVESETKQLAASLNGYIYSPSIASVSL